MDLVYVGVLFCALAFALVIIYISLVLKRVSKTMETLGETLGEVEEKMQRITPQLRTTVNETGKIVDDLNEKVAVADNLFDTLENIGTSLNACNQLLNRETKKLPEYTSSKDLDKVTEGIKWGDIALRLYKKWNNKDGKNELVVQDENLPVKK
ncbi:DUF948 domain-containing protein [Virgibacillus doumboii]|uniref:DUF948 domain-containing protein n=1 Tax=Virgibacillus doumboii TaxID=2697503 RepID=UPI0013DFBF3F|nr:DUF948 domain-containing protein [Virgibacillus doumboii]